MENFDTQQHVIQSCRDHDVKFIRLWFTDILGMLKSVAITIEELEHALDDGISFDGSAIEGFARNDESDMLIVPDPSTFQVLPWRPKEQAVARMFCDIQIPGGESFVGDPRNVLKRTLSSAAKTGFTFYISPEIEFFYFKNSETPEPLDQGGYFDLTPLDAGSDLRRETVLALEQMGIGVALSHHEAAPSQHEMDLRYTDALTMADAVMTYRLLVKEIALRHNVYATFMPKPLSDHNGSGMHLQLSLFRGEVNAFHESGNDLEISDVARHYIAGLLQHAPELMLVTNQWVNSYKRLVPGYEAPMYVTWSPHNHSDLVRVPAHKPGSEDSTRIEYRVPDAAANPYLAFSAVLAAGLKGIENKYSLPDPVLSSTESLSAKEISQLNLKVLPSSLGDAIEQFEASELMKETLGEHVHSTIVANKKIEWAEYRSQVTPFELSRYLPML
ncbi:MAG: glutamine synthetase family protein [Dehalococcoidia bacterium]|nr:glutamine synthetase family protein [Dehalococcoidia bacterium]|tara:strand:- start:12065 stop:13396 length:1332 start_codon:yes stop_codon:yes gene_type:complete